MNMKYNFVLVLVLIFVSAPSQGVELPTMCKTQISKLNQVYKSVGKWEKNFSTNGGVSFRSPTNSISKWIEIVYSENKVKLYAFKSPNKNILYKFDNCKFKKEVIPSEFSEKSTKSKFTDADLLDLLKEKGTGMVYVWSPKFSYSAKYLEIFRNLARENKVKFTAIRANDDSSDELSPKFSPRLQKINRSLELNMLKSDLHLPTTLFYKNSKWVRDPLVGVFDERSLAKILKDL